MSLASQNANWVEPTSDPSEFNAEDLPLVSCIMPTHDRRPFVAQAIRYFLRQDYPSRELLIVDDGADPIIDLVPEHPYVRYIRQDHRSNIGAKRNLACREARGEIIVHWDDDDWMNSWRLRYQVQSLLRERADICGLNKLLFYDPWSGRSWQYVYPTGDKEWVAGGTLCYTKAFWRDNPFSDINVGEDTCFVWSNSSKKIIALRDYNFYVALVHPKNTSPKQTADSRWHAYPTEEIWDLMSEDWSFYVNLSRAKYTRP